MRFDMDATTKRFRTFIAPGLRANAGREREAACLREWAARDGTALNSPAADDPPGGAAPTCADRRAQSAPAKATGFETGLAARLAFRVPEDRADERLDRFLASEAEAQGGVPLSRTRLKALIVAGRARVAGLSVVDPAWRLKAGDAIEIDVPPATPAQPAGEDIRICVIYEDDQLLVIEKPAGLVVHPAAGHPSGTLVNALIAHCADSLSGIGGVMRPGIVHRLDRKTSGLMVVAKTDAAHRGLAAQFADHGRSGSLVRAYRAFVWGVPAGRSGTINAALGRHARNREKMAVVRAESGRHAVTRWERDESFGATASLLTCRLETGRTHQIRVHLAHIGHPLLGDPVYGSGFKTKAAHLCIYGREALERLGRQALHAAILGFVHPVTGRELLFQSPLPQDLEGLAAALRAPRANQSHRHSGD